MRAVRDTRSDSGNEIFCGRRLEACLFDETEGLITIVKNDRSAVPTDGRGVAAQRSSSDDPAELKRPVVAKNATLIRRGELVGFVALASAMVLNGNLARPNAAH